MNYDEPVEKFLSRIRSMLESVDWEDETSGPNNDDLNRLSEISWPLEAKAEAGWKCKANRRADPPQDCEWPTCGCDPYANKVIDALREEGKVLVDTAVVEHALILQAARAVRDFCKYEEYPELMALIDRIRMDTDFRRLDAALRGEKP